jgi:hypothetical protein
MEKAFQGVREWANGRKALSVAGWLLGCCEQPVDAVELNAEGEFAALEGSLRQEMGLSRLRDLSLRPLTDQVCPPRCLTGCEIWPWKGGQSQDLCMPLGNQV